MNLSTKRRVLGELVESDERLKAYVIQKSDGTFRPLQLDDLVQQLEGIELNRSVPEESRVVFAVAKRLYIFAFYCYEFFTVSNHYSFLALEAAVIHKGRAVDPNLAGRVSFKKVLEKLRQKRIVGESEAGLFHAARELRNSFSHLAQSKLLPPGVGGLGRVAELINYLYKARKA